MSDRNVTTQNRALQQRLGDLEDRVLQMQKRQRWNGAVQSAGGGAFVDHVVTNGTNAIDTVQLTPGRWAAVAAGQVEVVAAGDFPVLTIVQVDLVNPSYSVVGLGAGPEVGSWADGDVVQFAGTATFVVPSGAGFEPTVAHLNVVTLWGISDGWIFQDATANAIFIPC